MFIGEKKKMGGLEATWFMADRVLLPWRWEYFWNQRLRTDSTFVVAKELSSACCNTDE